MKKIPLDPNYTLHYIVDSNFFANKYLKSSEGSNPEDCKRIENSHIWWEELIDWQIENHNAIVYINDLCIAETFKIIAKKYYQENAFNSNAYQSIRNQISSDIQLSVRKLISKTRKIKYHNITVDRDIIIGVSRYLETAHKNNLQSVSIIDLTILSSAKYLMDFYKISRDKIIILTGDTRLIRCAKLANDGPIIIDPLNPKNNFERYCY